MFFVEKIRNLFTNEDFIKIDEVCKMTLCFSLFVVNIERFIYVRLFVFWYFLPVVCGSYYVNEQLTYLFLLFILLTVDWEVNWMKHSFYNASCCSIYCCPKGLKATKKYFLKKDTFLLFLLYPPLKLKGITMNACWCSKKKKY